MEIAIVIIIVMAANVGTVGGSQLQSIKQAEEEKHAAGKYEDDDGNMGLKIRDSEKEREKQEFGEEFSDMESNEKRERERSRCYFHLQPLEEEKTCK